MKTFEAELREAGNNSTFEITIPKKIVEYEKLESGKAYKFAIILDGEPNATN